MDIKVELKEIIRSRFEATASRTFLERAFAVIEEASNEKENLMTAAERVGKMVSLFIDADLGKEIYGTLKARIEKAF